jgi:hypothetical protein
MQKIFKQLSLFIGILLLHTTLLTFHGTRFRQGSSFYDKNEREKKPLVVDPDTMSISKLQRLKEIKKNHPLLFFLITCACAHRSPEEAEKAMRADHPPVGTNPDLVETILWSRRYSYSAESKKSIVSLQKIASALEDQGDGCKRFKELIVARNEEYQKTEKAREKAIRKKMKEEETKRRNSLLVELDFPLKDTSPVEKE